MSHKVNRNKYDAIIMCNFPLFSFGNISPNQTYLSSDIKHRVNAKTLPGQKGTRLLSPWEGAAGA